MENRKLLKETEFYSSIYKRSVVAVHDFIERIRLGQDKSKSNALTQSSEPHIQKIRMYFTAENIQLPALISMFGKGNHWS